jgi:LCP family protein required for cell wall assembly
MSNIQTISMRARARALGLVLLGAAASVSAWPSRVFAQDDSGVQPAHINHPMNIVAGGLDSRGSDQPENTDVLMIARVDLQSRSVRAISIPRDLYLQIPGYGYDKITRAYDYGSKADGGKFKAGAALVNDTINSNFGVTVDGVVLTTFDGFAEVVDALGGVDVDNPYEVYDAEYPTPDYGTKVIDFPAGAIHLAGSEALEFSRTRHQDGDDGRVMRQQLVLRALLDRARDSKVSPDLPKIVTAHRSAVRTDLGPSKQLAFALAAPDFTNDSVTFATLTAAGLVYPDTAPNGAWIYSGVWDQIPGYVEGFLSGQ